MEVHNLISRTSHNRHTAELKIHCMRIVKSEKRERTKEGLPFHGRSGHPVTLPIAI